MDQHNIPHPRLLNLISSVSERLGKLSARNPGKISPEARRDVRIDTIHATMYLEGKTLPRERISAIIQKRPVTGLQISILEILNAVKVYDQLPELNPWSEASLLSAHRTLLTGVGEEPGLFRTTETAIFRGRQILHMAPAPEKVPFYMDDLFRRLNSKNENILVKSCIAHYTMECLQPFSEASGIMGRFLLISPHPLQAVISQ